MVAGGSIVTGCEMNPLSAEVPLSTIATLESPPPAQEPNPETSPESNTEPSTIAIAGEVEAHAPLVNAGLYRINDGTGTLWIQTETLPLPPLGDRPPVEFIPQYRAISIENQTFNQTFGLEQKRTPLTE